MNASTSATTTTTTHQYSRITSIFVSPFPLSVIAPTKLDQIGEHQADEEPDNGKQRSLGDQRQPPAAGRPADAADSGQLVEHADQLATLEIVGGTGARQPPRSRIPVPLSSYRRQPVITER